VVNPPNLVAPDGWVAFDRVFSKEALATALTAIAAGHQIQLFVSSTQCAQDRPMILDFQVNWGATSRAVLSQRIVPVRGTSRGREMNVRLLMRATLAILIAGVVSPMWCD